MLLRYAASHVCNWAMIRHSCFWIHPGTAAPCFGRQTSNCIRHSSQCYLSVYEQIPHPSEEVKHEPCRRGCHCTHSRIPMHSSSRQPAPRWTFRTHDQGHTTYGRSPLITMSTLFWSWLSTTTSPSRAALVGNEYRGEHTNTYVQQYINAYTSTSGTALVQRTQIIGFQREL